MLPLMNQLVERRRSVIALLLALGCAAMPPAAAQEPPRDFIGAAARPRPRFDVSQTLTGLARRVRETAVADQTVASAAWLVLAFHENGSTMKVGTHRESVRMMVRTLLELQGPGGQFARNGVAGSRSDQMVGALALLVAFERSQHRPLRAPAMKACEAVLAMKAPDAKTPTNEEVALVTLLLPTLSNLAPGEPEAAVAADRLKAMAGELLASRKFGETRRGDAALHFGQLMLGEPHPPELTVARTWPANLTADPLHMLFAMLAVSTDEKSLARQSNLIDGLLAARASAGSNAGMWPAAAGLDETTTTAMLTMGTGVANGSPLLLRPK